MTEELQHSLIDRLEKAREKKDIELISEAQSDICISTMACQVKSGDRIKRMENDVTQIRNGIEVIQRQMTDVATSRAILTEKYDATTQGLNEVRNEIRSWKDKAHGAGWGIKLAIGLGSIFGFELLKKLGTLASFMGK